MTERDIQQQIMLDIGGRSDCRIWRNNVALAYVGVPIRQRDGSILLRNPRPLHAGLCNGSGDLIGFQAVQIRPEHVGETWGRFLSIECKAPRGRPSEAQQNWQQVVTRFGGLAGFARSVEEARQILIP